MLYVYKYDSVESKEICVRILGNILIDFIFLCIILLV